MMPFKNSICLSGIILVLILLCFAHSNAQMRDGKMPGPERQFAEMPPVYFEFLNFSGDSAGYCRVDIPYRISYDFFIFVRDTAGGARYPYIAHGDLVCDVLDSAGNSVERKIVHKQIGIEAQRTGFPEKRFVQGIVSLQLRPGTYKLVTELTDKESERRYFDDKRIIKVKNLSSSVLGISDVLFAEANNVKGEDARLLPLNFGGDVPFGSDFNGYLEISSLLSPDSIVMQYGLKKLSPRERDTRILFEKTINPQSFVLSARLAMDNGDAGATYCVRKPAGTGKFVVCLNFEGDSLEEGEYELHLKYKGGAISDTLNKKFRIRWFDMPMLLRNPQAVLTVMEYVMSDSEYADFKNSDGDDRMKKFKDFWKRRDPTPGTAYNEALAEYFRRVDYTAVTFSSLSERNGYTLDRGKAYIIYGAPGKTERNLTGNSVAQEIWYYPNLQKKLVFVDQAHKGEYRLTSIEQY
jgi:GWxTD domain-containing protein